MNFLKLLLLSLFLVVPAFAQSTNRVTIQLTVTNGTSNSFSMTLNGDTRTFATSVSLPASEIYTNDTIAGSASNLYNHIVSSPFSRVRIFGYTNGSDTIYLRGDLGLSMSATILSNWATLSYSTQVFSSGLIGVRVPIETETATQATNIASLITRAIGNLATNSIRADAPAMANFLGLTNEQTMTRKTLTGPFINNGTNSGTVLTNIPRANVGVLVATNVNVLGGTVSNVTLTNISYINSTVARLDTLTVWTAATITNLSAPGTGLSSLQIGNTAAGGDYSIAIGVTAEAPTNYASAVGYNARSTEVGGTAMGFESSALAYYTTAVGAGANATKVFASSFGQNASANYSNSTAIGASATTTTTNQIRLGTASETVSIPGKLEAASITNGLFTGTNVWSGDVSYSRYDVSTLANGNNIAVTFGTNYNINLSGTCLLYTSDAADE